VSVVGGDIQLVGGTLVAPSGQLQMASVASPGEVQGSPFRVAPTLPEEYGSRLGRIALSQDSRLDTSGNGGGTVLIRGGSLLVDRAAIVANNQGEVVSTNPGVDVEITEDVVLTNGGVITTEGQGSSSNAGAIRVEAGTLTLAEGAKISASAQQESSGIAGQVMVRADTLTVTGNSSITANGGSKGGTVRIWGRTVRVERQASITAHALGERGEQAGTVEITADTLTLNAGGGLGSRSAGDGAPGMIAIQVGTLEVTNGGVIIGSTTGTAQGTGSTVQITATNMFVGGQPDRPGRQRSHIVSNTVGEGLAGEIIIHTDQLVLAAESQIATNTRGTGDAGAIRITADTMIIAGGQLESATGDQGNGGTIELAVDRLVVTDGGQITSGTSIERPGGDLLVGTGRGGDIRVHATRIALDREARINASTLGGGQGGGIALRARTIQLTNGAEISAESSGEGPGGDIDLHAQEIWLTEGAIISATSNAMGRAGNLRITATERFQSDRSTIKTEAIQASGGNVELRAGSQVRLRDSTLTAAVAGEAVSGNIDMQAQVVLVEGSAILANAPVGRGGHITVAAEGFLRDTASRLDASGGVAAGVVEIQAVTNLSGLVTSLPPDFALATALLRDPCTARLREGTVSSFVVRGRASLPVTADGLLPGRLYVPQQHRTTAGAAPPPQEPTGFPQGGNRGEPSGHFQRLPEVAPALALLGLGHPCGSP
jgi:large exoprotein involved in heme utilization and adhesion